MKLIKWLCFGCLAIVLLFCNKQYQLENSKTSKEDVILDTMSAIRRDNLNDFNKILLSRQEHNEYFWPNIGEKFHADKGINADIAYDMMLAETNMRLNVLLSFYKGKVFEIKNIQCSRPVENYGPFSLYLGCNFDVILLNGEVLKERTLNGVICLNKQCKLYHLKD
ncbi:hypothetical protein [Leptospira kanakyensis]|uniref:Uncharacterized protein n=2 Tax=Leptospira kanakyensis TaxID=2484968 RepID=A0A6N4QA41_9LEPT|nr:hypothetical protein [Leptospira kanakyensis]MCW7480024.1 hypothetical protein [Leptospira kanakyensis]TGK50245.1 hypothetical protein EHQ11_11085 [Leptospira kanakyensis]TGK69384.1 hypothetical protein EHQ18_11245 [Leptospira kanakyensis]